MVKLLSARRAVDLLLKMDDSSKLVRTMTRLVVFCHRNRLISLSILIMINLS